MLYWGKASESSKDQQDKWKLRSLGSSHPPTERHTGARKLWGPQCGSVRQWRPLSQLLLSSHGPSVRTNLTVVPGSLDLPAVYRSCLKMPTAQILGYETPMWTLETLLSGKEPLSPQAYLRCSSSQERRQESPSSPRWLSIPETQSKHPL